jgi:hypothetical protein
MSGNYWNTAIAALAAVLLTLMVLIFVAHNPWMLLGVAGVLWAIAAIVRAINRNSGGEQHGDHDADHDGHHRVERQHDRPAVADGSDEAGERFDGPVDPPSTAEPC